MEVFPLGLCFNITYAGNKTSRNEQKIGYCLGLNVHGMNVMHACNLLSKYIYIL
jgi:hypothetical protein